MRCGRGPVREGRTLATVLDCRPAKAHGRIWIERWVDGHNAVPALLRLSLIHISEPTRLALI
eukprot:8128767-Alexandrium_andersonii.AAC.1